MATAATTALMSSSISSTRGLFDLLDEDHVPWKNVLLICRELADSNPVLHFIIDRNPPPKYISDLLKIRQKDLLVGQATVILQKHVWCYPLGIAAMLSSDHVFIDIAMATKQALLLRNEKASMRIDLILLEGISISKLPPNRLTVIMQHFSSDRIIKESLLRVLLFEHESASWDIIQCILEHHPSLSDVETSSDMGINFFQILFDCSQIGTIHPSLITKIPRLVHSLVRKNGCSNPYLLRVALDTLAPLTNPKKRKSGSSIIPEVLRIVLHACPKAARHRCSTTGRLPLHLATQVEGCMHIARAHPIALKTRCPVTKLYPFQLAALHQYSDDNNSSVEIGWKLLRAAPELLCIPTTTSSSELTAQRLKLARHEMNMARRIRRFAEQRKASDQAERRELTQMTQTRLALQQQLLPLSLANTASQLKQASHHEELPNSQKEASKVGGARRSKRRRS